MKLFYQLTPAQQEKIINHCIDLVLDDILQGEIRLEAISEEELKLKNKIDEAVEYTKQLSSREEKVEYLMTDPEIYSIVNDFAVEMSKSAYYHSPDEIVFYEDQFSTEEDTKILTEKKKVSKLN